MVTDQPSRGGRCPPPMAPKLDQILRRLIWLSAPKVFIITVLMIGHLSCVELMGDPGYQVLEFYAGQRRAARLASGLGQTCAAMDIMYDPLGDNKKVNNCMDMNTSAGFTLACILVLQARWDEFLALFGICCSTYVSISRGSTKRSTFLPMGCPISLANYRANKGTARSMLVVLLTIAAGGIPLIENLGSTLIHLSDRFQKLVALLRARGFRLYRQAFWMKHYGHMCLKRTLVWSISPAILLLDLGPVLKGVHKSEVKTALKYVDKNGKTRYKGNGKTLKGTQLYPPGFASKIIEHQWDFVNDKPQFPDEALRKDDLFQSLADLETGDPWDDAELWSVYSYVRGSKKLRLPEEYRPLLFTSAS